MSEKLSSYLLDDATEIAALSHPLDAEILEKLRRLFYELPRTAVHYCDVVTVEGDRRRIKHHPTSTTSFIVDGPRGGAEIDLADPSSYCGLFIPEGLLATITQDSTDAGLERIRLQHRLNAALKLSIG